MPRNAYNRRPPTYVYSYVPAISPESTRTVGASDDKPFAHIETDPMKHHDRTTNVTTLPVFFILISRYFAAMPLCDQHAFTPRSYDSYLASSGQNLKKKQSLINRIKKKLVKSYFKPWNTNFFKFVVMFFKNLY